MNSQIAADFYPKNFPDVAYSIEFTKKALDPNSEEYQSLCKSVRKVLGIIVGLLKDRACAERRT